MTAADDTERVMVSDMRRQLRRGAVDVAPVLGFTLALAITGESLTAVGVALSVALMIMLYRLWRRERIRHVLVGMAVIGLGGGLTLATDDATSFYLPGLMITATTLVATPVMVSLGWPPLGLLVGAIKREGTRWRQCAIRRRAFGRASLASEAPSILVLSVELPLFIAGQAVALGFTQTLTPICLGFGLFVAWRVYHRSMGEHRCEPGVCWSVPAMSASVGTTAPSL